MKTPKRAFPATRFHARVRVQLTARVSHIAQAGAGARPSGANMPMPICNCIRVFAIRRNAGCVFKMPMLIGVRRAARRSRGATCGDLGRAWDDHRQVTGAARSLWSADDEATVCCDSMLRELDCKCEGRSI